jgi:hypothetical protein
MLAKGTTVGKSIVIGVSAFRQGNSFDCNAVLHFCLWWLCDQGNIDFLVFECHLLHYEHLKVLKGQSIW